MLRGRQRFLEWNNSFSSDLFFFFKYGATISNVGDHDFCFWNESIKIPFFRLQVFRGAIIPLVNLKYASRGGIPIGLQLLLHKSTSSLGKKEFFSCLAYTGFHHPLWFALFIYSFPPHFSFLFLHPPFYVPVSVLGEGEGRRSSREGLHPHSPVF